MGLEDIGDKVRKRTKKKRAEDLGLDEIDKLEDIDEIQDRLNSISQAHVSQDKRIEDLEDDLETLWKVVKILLEDYSDENETDQHMGVGDEGEYREETGTVQEPDNGDSSIGDSEGERGYGWLTDDE